LSRAPSRSTHPRIAAETAAATAGLFVDLDNGTLLQEVETVAVANSMCACLLALVKYSGLPAASKKSQQPMKNTAGAFFTGRNGNAGAKAGTAKLVGV
jgi:hypothetical protein